jgi:hypothetical protein
MRSAAAGQACIRETTHAAAQPTVLPPVSSASVPQYCRHALYAKFSLRQQRRWSAHLLCLLPTRKRSGWPRQSQPWQQQRLQTACPTPCRTTKCTQQQRVEESKRHPIVVGACDKHTWWSCLLCHPTCCCSTVADVLLYSTLLPPPYALPARHPTHCSHSSHTSIHAGHCNHTSAEARCVLLLHNDACASRPRGLPYMPARRKHNAAWHYCHH